MALLYHGTRFQPLDGNGDPYPGALLYFYLTTTTTAADVYTDSALTTTHAQPVVADASGIFAPIYLDPTVTYKTTLRESDSTLIVTTDPVSGPESRVINATSLTEPAFLIYSNYATASKQANLTSITYGVSGGGTVHVNHANGTYASPSATLSGELTGGIGSRAYHNGGAFQVSSPAAIHWQATENQTSTAYGMWIRFLTTPKSSTTRREVGGITDNQTIWSHDTGTYNPLDADQTLPVADARFVASGTAGSAGGGVYAAVAHGISATPGFRGLHSRGTAGARTVNASGDVLAFFGGHGFDGTDFTTATQAMVSAVASETFSSTAQGAYLSFAATPSTTTTRAEVARFDASTTATHTRFMIYDVDNGTLERVTVGAADSGGAGYKVLRIPN